MSKKKKAQADDRRDGEAAEVRRAIGHLEQSPPQVDAALAALRGAAIGLVAAEAAEGESEGAEE